MSSRGSRDGVVQVQAELIATRRVGDYCHLTVAAGDVARLATPGQFVALAVGGPTSGHLLRRSFSIHRTTPAADGGTVEIVVAEVGPGTRWLAALHPRDPVDLVGPLGRGFDLPDVPQPCILVGGGYGSAPLFWLAERIRSRGGVAHLILGAATESRLFRVVEGGADAEEMTVTTVDGSVGRRGMVTDALPAVLERTGAAVVYACGPMGMLRAVTEMALAHGATAQVAVEEAMACGVGVCMTCVLPIRGRDGLTRMTRSCIDGPVFSGDRVRWDCIDGGHSRVPADAVGAAAQGSA